MNEQQAHMGNRVVQNTEDKGWQNPKPKVQNVKENTEKSGDTQHRGDRRTDTETEKHKERIDKQLFRQR